MSQRPWRDYRNRIHPEKVRRDQVVVDKGHAQIGAAFGESRVSPGDCLLPRRRRSCTFGHISLLGRGEAATLISVTSAAKKVLQDALSLSPEDREELLTALSESLDPVELSPEWRDEIGRRLAKFERGEAVVHDAEEHAKNLLAKYGG